MDLKETYYQRYRSKVVSADAAAATIQSGDVVVMSGGSSQPTAFLHALGRRRDLNRVTLYSSMPLVPPDFLVRQYTAKKEGDAADTGIRFACFDVGPGVRDAAAAGVVDRVPVNSRVLGRLLQHMRVNVVVVAAAGMDQEGNVNLGCNVDSMQDLLAAAEQTDTVVVVEVNRRLPWTEGETTFRIESVDHLVESDRAIPDLPPGAPLPEAQAVGGLLATLVPDEATLHLDVGELARQAAMLLDGRRDLAVHSDFIGDTFRHLHERGALTSRKKGFSPGKWVGSFLLGSQDLYEFAGHNEMVSLHPVDFVAEPANIARNHRMTSICQASQVDLTGQVAGQSASFEFLSNPGVQHAFHTAASRTAGGAGVVVLPSTAAAGRVSNVVTALSPGYSAAIPSGDADMVVTEHGVARLRGKSLSQRALNLIAIAHPAHRDRLAFDARKMGLM